MNTYLQGYDQHLRNKLYQGFLYGFPIFSSYRNNIVPSYTNHRSALDNPIVVQSKIDKELCLGRIAGPFNSPPLPSMIISPLGLVPKKASAEWRLIHDLSFPKESSVNSNIEPYFTRVQYQDLDHCISIISSLGQGTLIAKADLKDAFRILPIHPSAHRLLGFSWNEQYYYDKHLPMGCSLSCQLFETLSTAVQWILQNKLGVDHMSHILDDFMFFSPPGSKKCKLYLDTFIHLADSLNLPIKHTKTVLPTTCVSLHGIEVDTAAMSIRLPLDKLKDAQRKVTAMSKRKKTSLSELQSLLGTLNFACKVIVPGRAFLRRLFDLTKGLVKKDHWIRLTRAARLDLQAWAVFLTSFNGRVLCLPNAWTSSSSIKLYSDASGAAFAAVFGSTWLQGTFPGKWRHSNIAIKELLPIVLAVRLWAKELSNQRILFFCDNQAIVYVINKQSSKEPTIMALIRTLVSVTLNYNIHFMAKHIPGKKNVIADLLSRSQVTKALQVAPWLDKTPVAFPPQWLPW